MNSKEITLSKLNKAIDELDKAILENKKNVMTITSKEQLRFFKIKFLHALQDIQHNQTLEKKDRNLGISRIVIDQWPFDLYLGEVLIEAEQAYKEF